VYKNLFSQRLVETQTGYPNFFKLEDIADYVSSPEFINLAEQSSYSKKVPGLHNHYVDNLMYIREVGIPNNKHEQFNFSNLNKLKQIEILERQSQFDPIDALDKFEWIAHEENSIVINDSVIMTSMDMGTKKPFGVQILDNIKFNKQKQDEYIKIIEPTEDFRNLTYALTPFTNVVIFPNGSKERYFNKPLNIYYYNSTKDPILEANTTIVDVQYNTKVKVNEFVKNDAGQMNYVTYIVREDAELEINRSTTDNGGWGIFDSRFVCHPGSKVTINFDNQGSKYSQENFYFKCSSHVEVNLKGRNNILQGNEYHQYVLVKSQNDNNKSVIDIKNVGREKANTSFIGKFDVSPYSIGFNGEMNNDNLMLTKDTKMHTRPILDIHTKEIECSHGCTISNINNEQMYYLQSRGFDKDSAKDILVESFLC
jgi:Fe-S cluster assembly protein SufD